MTEATAGRNPVNSDDDEASVLARASVVLSWRRTIVVLAVLGAAIGLSPGLTYEDFKSRHQNENA